MNVHQMKAERLRRMAENDSGATPRVKLLAAFARARGEFPEVPRTRVANVKSEKASYSFMYADLADIHNAVDPVLAAHGLGVFQEVIEEGGAEFVVTHVFHEGGGEITSKLRIRPAGKWAKLDDAVEFQAAHTRFRRYALCAALGIATEETTEGTRSTSKKSDLGMDAEFNTGDGVRMPKGAGKPDPNPRKRAEQAAEAIIGQFKDAKTRVGVSGAWDRNEAFIDRLQANHNDLFQSVFDAFHARMDALAGEPAE